MKLFYPKDFDKKWKPLIFTLLLLFIIGNFLVNLSRLLNWFAQEPILPSWFNSLQTLRYFILMILLLVLIRGNSYGLYLFALFAIISSPLSTLQSWLVLEGTNVQQRVFTVPYLLPPLLRDVILVAIVMYTARFFDLISKKKFFT